MEQENKKELNKQKEKINKKKLIKRIIKIAVLLVVGFIVISLLPFLYFIVIHHNSIP